MKKTLLLLTSIYLQGCGPLHSLTPDDVINSVNTSQIGYSKYSVTVNKPMSEVSKLLEGKMRKCYESKVVSTVIRQNNMVTGGVSDTHHIDVTHKNPDLTVIALRKEILSNHIGPNELVHFALEVSKVSKSQTLVTTYQAYGFKPDGEAVILWAQGKKATCPVDEKEI